MIRLVKKNDINELAKIYKDLYDNVDIGENWTIEKATELLTYWYNKQGDLFFVSEEDGKPVGAIMSGVKSWFDGLRLNDTEIFVSNEYQGKHIAKDLMLEHLKQAKIKYNAKMIEFHTYGDEDEFPQNWYNRIGFEKDSELIIMHADIENVLNKLGYISEGKITSFTPEIINYSYDDISNLYSNLKSGDTAYIFDMLPEYAYADDDNERKYIESRITAMKNGANVSLFIIGSKNRLTELSNNDLFNHTINNCYGNSKIYIIDEEELKQKCPADYFQLAKGLYFGEHADGSKDVFRDLWIDSNNIGLLIKNDSILTFIENSINNIISRINNNEIKINHLIEKQ